MSIIVLIWNIVIGSLWGRIIGALLLGLAALHANNVYQRHVGKQQVVAAAEKKAGENDVKATEAHNRAERPGAAKRLRDNSCRDC